MQSYVPVADTTELQIIVAPLSYMTPMRALGSPPVPVNLSSLELVMSSLSLAPSSVDGCKSGVEGCELVVSIVMLVVAKSGYANRDTFIT